MPHLRMATRTALAVAVLLAGSCAETSDDEPAPADISYDTDPATWAASTDPVTTDGLIWAADDTVHLSDNTTIEVGEPMTTYVVAGDGIYFTPADSDDDGTAHSNMTTGPLHYADRDGTVTDTGLTIYVESLGSSPDGRYLGLIDATAGPEDQFGTPLATAVILDLTTGKRLVDTTDGMGDPQVDDLVDAYPEVYLGVRFLDDDRAFVEGLDDILYTLPDGGGEPVDAIDAGLRNPLDRTSPDGAWNIDDRGAVEVLLSADRERVQPRTGTPRWGLGWWLDDETVVGVALSGPGRGKSVGPDDTATLITCRVPDGACQDVEGTTGQLVRFPSEGALTGALDLRGGESS